MGAYRYRYSLDKDGCSSYFRGKSWGFGSKNAIEFLRDRLAKNLAMHEQTPMVGKTGMGRVGIYGVGPSVVSLTTEAVDFIKRGGLVKEGE